MIVFLRFDQDFLSNYPFYFKNRTNGYENKNNYFLLIDSIQDGKLSIYYKGFSGLCQVKRPLLFCFPHIG